MRATPTRWVPFWRYSKQKKEHWRSEGPIWFAGDPMLFDTRRECRAWIEERYGYIKERKDLRGAPHYWRMPVPVRCYVRLEPVDERQRG